MKLRNINIVIGREYATKVKKKSFLITTFLAPIFFAAMCILPSVIMFMAEDKAKNVAVIDNSGIVMETLADSRTATYVDCSNISLDSLKSAVMNGEYDLVLDISAINESTKSVNVASYSKKPLSLDLETEISNNVDDAIEAYRIESYDVDNLKQIMDDVKSDVTLATYTLGDDGEEKISISGIYMVISMVLSIIIYMFVAMFSGMVMQSVIEEKNSRVVEVLVSSVKATELMFGKIIGVALVALTQFVLWILLSGILIGGASAIFGFDKMIESAKVQTEQMNQMSAVAGDEASGMMAMPDVSTVMEDNELAVMLSTLADINWAQMIVAFVVFFILGYLMYASLFAAIGSAVENEADTQQLQLPITIPLMLAFFIALYAFKAPDSAVVFWGSMIPFTSPIVMLARIPYGVPGWELALSIGLLLLTFVFCAWLSAKIYKIGILMFGKKTTFKDLWKWLKQK
ncbi:MAG: ABC transporter permease [Candidatus Cryptobacteroides sp.]